MSLWSGQRSYTATTPRKTSAKRTSTKMIHFISFHKGLRGIWVYEGVNAPGGFLYIYTEGPPGAPIGTHFQILSEPLLAGFWHRWYFFGRFRAILNIPMQIDITKSEWKMFSTHVWMCIYLDVDFYYYSKFGQIHTHKKPAWLLWSFSGFPHRFT